MPEKAERHQSRATQVAPRNVSPKWAREDDAIADSANGCTPVDFIAALKNQSEAAWVALKTIIFNPVLNEKKIHTLVEEKKFEPDEIFGIFVEQMVGKGKLDKIREPDKSISFLQQCIRNQITNCTTRKAKERDGRIVFIDDCFKDRTGDGSKDVTNIIDSIPEDEAVVAARDSRLMEDEKAIVRRCFEEFWRQHPSHAYVLAFRNMGLNDKEIQVLMGKSKPNSVTQLAHRGGEALAKRLMSKKLDLPGIPKKAGRGKIRRKHV